MAWRALGARDLGSALAQLRQARHLTSTFAVAREVGHLLAQTVRAPRSP